MVKKKIDKATLKLNRLLDSNYYSTVIDAWFVVLEKVGGNPSRIRKENLIKEAGLRNHQRFDAEFGQIEGIYNRAKTKFCKRIEKVAYAYRHQFIPGAKIWSLFFDAIIDCKRECKMAMIRKDTEFFAASLDVLREYFKDIVCSEDFEEEPEAVYETRTYRYCFSVAVAVVVTAIYEWDATNYSENAKAKLIQDIPGLLYCLDHPNATFIRVLGR